MLDKVKLFCDTNSVLATDDVPENMTMLFEMFT